MPTILRKFSMSEREEVETWQKSISNTLLEPDPGHSRKAFENPRLPSSQNQVDV